MKKRIILAAWTIIMLQAFSTRDLQAQQAADEKRLDYLVRSVYNQGGNGSVLDAPYAAQVAPDGDLYIADTANNRIVKFVKGDFANVVYYPSAAAKISMPETGVVAGSVGTTDPKILAYSRVDTDRKLLKPIAIALDTVYVYVADTGNGRVIALKEDEGLEELKFSHALGYFKDVGLIKDIATDGAGNVYLLDSRNGRVMKYLWYGEKKKFSEEVEEITGLMNPQGLAIDAAHIYVTDTARHEVVVYGLDGKEMKRFGAKGKEDGEMLYPNDVVADADGNIYVADTENYRIEKYSAAGEYIGKYGDWGKNKGQFMHNRKISLGTKDGKVYLYAVDSSKMDAQVIDMNPTFVISHDPFKVITKNPATWKATVESHATGTVTLSLNYKILGGAEGTAAVPMMGDGSYQVAHTIPGLKTGDTLDYRFKGEMSSGAVNYSELTKVFVDMTPPALADPEAVTFKPAEGSVAGAGGAMVEAMYSDLGLGVDETKIKLFLDGQEIKPDALSASALKAKIPASQMQEGEREIELRLYDKAGNETIRKRKIVADKTAPAITGADLRLLDYPGKTIIKDAENRYITTKRIEVVAKIEDLTLDEYRIDITPPDSSEWKELQAAQKTTGTPLNVSFPFNSQNYDDGKARIKITAKDRAGNETVHIFEISIDNTRPFGAIVEPYFGQVLIPELEVVGGSIKVKARMTDDYLSSYSVKAGPFTQSNPSQCENGHNLSPQTLISGSNQAPEKTVGLEKEFMWELPMESGSAPRIYTLSLRMKDAYQDITICQSFNVGLEGIVITPLPQRDMVGNTIKYDLSDSGHADVEIYKAAKYDPITTLDQLTSTTNAEKIRTIISGVDQARGINTVIWDGKTDGGQTAPLSSDTNIYYYLITAENDAYQKSREFGKLTILSIPKIISLNKDSSTYRICYQVDRGNLAERNLTIAYTSGGVVKKYSVGDTPLDGAANGIYTYCANWDGKNKYSQEIEWKTYKISLYVKDANGSEASYQIFVDMGMKEPALSNTSASNMRTNIIKNTAQSPEWDINTNLVAGKIIMPNSKDSEEIETQARSFEAQTVKALAIKENVEILKNVRAASLIEWDGKTTTTLNTLGMYTFSAYSSAWAYQGEREMELFSRPNAPQLAISDMSTATDILFRVSYIDQEELVKKWVVSVYDNERNLIARSVNDGAGFEYKSSLTLGLPERDVEAWSRYRDISSAGKQNMLTNMLSVKACAENIAGKISCLEQAFPMSANFTEDTGAVVISQDGKAKLSIPPRSALSGVASYKDFAVEQHSDPAANTAYPALPSGVNFLGKVYEFSPAGAEFDKNNPPILTLYYEVDSGTGNIVMNGEHIGAPEDVLAFYYFNEAENTYERVGGAFGIDNYGRQGEAHFIWAPLYHLSEYFLAVKKDFAMPVAKIIRPLESESQGKEFGVFIDAYDEETQYGCYWDYEVTDSEVCGAIGVKETSVKNYSIEYGAGLEPSIWINMAKGAGLNKNVKAGVWQATGLTGPYVLRLTAEDAAGNKTTVKAHYNFAGGTPVTVIDATPPVISKVSLSSLMMASRTPATSRNSVTLSFEASESSMVAIDLIDDKSGIIRSAKPSYAAAAMKTEYFVFTGVLTNGEMAGDGRYRFKITAIDQWGNKSNAYSEWFVNDNVAPAFSSMTPSQGSVAPNIKPVISTVVDDGKGAGVDPTGFTIRFNDSPMPTGYVYNATTKTLSFTAPTNLLGGTNRVSVKTMDMLSNSAYIEWSFIGDMIPPSIHSVTETNNPFSPSESFGMKDEWRFTAQITESSPYTWSMEIEDATRTLKYATGSATIGGAPYTGVIVSWDGMLRKYDADGDRDIEVLDDAVYNYSLVVVDSSGNTSTRAGTIEIDNTPPSIGAFASQTIVLSPSTTPGVNDQLSAPIELTEKNPGAKEFIISDIYGRKAFTSSGAYNSGLNLMAWDGKTNAGVYAPDGMYGASIIYYDLAGNFVLASKGAVIDNLPPTTTDNATNSLYRTTPVMRLKSVDETSGVKEIKYCAYKTGVDAICSPSLIYDDNIGIIVPSDGIWAIRYSASDYGMNVETVKTSTVFTVNTAAPSQPSLTTIDVKNASTPVYSSESAPWIQGNAEPGTINKVYILKSDGTPDILVCSATAGANGVFVAKSTYEFTNGQYNLYATSEYSGGRVSLKSGIRIFVMDSIVPTLNDNAPSTWNKNSVALRISFSGSASGPKEIRYCVYSNSTAECDPFGPSAVVVNNSYSATTYINDTGTWNVRYAGEDLAENISEVKTAVVRIDKELPTGTVSHAYAGAVARSMISFNMTGYDSFSGISRVQYCLYKSGAAQCNPYGLGRVMMNTNSSATAYVSQQGEWHIRFVFLDLAGNNSAIYEDVAVIDISSPIQLSWTPAKGGQLSYASPSVAVSLNEPSQCKWSFTDASYATMSNNCAQGTGGSTAICSISNPQEGANKISISCSDLYGNEDTSLTNTDATYYYYAPLNIQISGKLFPDTPDVGQEPIFNYVINNMTTKDFLNAKIEGRITDANGKVVSNFIDIIPKVSASKSIAKSAYFSPILSSKGLHFTKLLLTVEPPRPPINFDFGTFQLDCCE